MSDKKTYTLINSDGHTYVSNTPGAIGGYKRGELYGRLDCPSALRAIAQGGYIKHRVFFENEEIAIAAGYRPCAICLPKKYAQWKSRQNEEK
jgi:hypothetical protein